MEQSEKDLKKRRFLMALPLVCLPFMAIMFWVLGGGKVEQASENEDKNALNTALPDAHLKEGELKDKMDYYTQANNDSLKLYELMKNDPNYNGLHSNNQAYAPDGLNTSLNGTGFNNRQEEKIYDRLALLNAEINKPYQPSQNQFEQYQKPAYAQSMPNGEVDRLEDMMKKMSEPEGEDLEMKQLNGMMDKILEIQHPELVKQKLKENAKDQRDGVFSVSKKKNQTPVSLLDNKSVKDYAAEYNEQTIKNPNGFFGLGNLASETLVDNAIEAVVHQNQTIVSGAVVKLRLLHELMVNGTKFPKDVFIYGTASLKGERLEITVESIKFKNSLFPVNLSVYDNDGLAGIYIPGAITRDVAKQSAEQSVQGISFGSLDQSVGAQAASAGIELGKNLFSKKIKLIKVDVKAGYKILLKDNNRKND